MSQTRSSSGYKMFFFLKKKIKVENVIENLINLVCYDVSKQEDVDLMDYIGVNSYRFSISWARILPSKFFNHSKGYPSNLIAEVGICISTSHSLHSYL